MNRARPFIKWVGGKTQLLPILSQMMPKHYKTYYEPFVGGGAFFFHLQPKHAVINDVNPVLINAYRQIQKNVERVNLQLRILDCNIARKGEPYFYEVRDFFNQKMRAGEYDTLLAAMFVFLSKHSFNGLFRLNAKGDYNTPSNHSDVLSTPASDLLEVKEALQYTNILCGDFQASLDWAKEGDFVFLDSPYAPLKETSFDKYTEDGFAKEDHERLAKTFRNLTEHGVSCMLTNHGTPFIRRLYDGFHIHEVSVRRSINSDGKHRTGREVIITNYEPRIFP